MSVKQSSFYPGLPAPCLHSRTAASTPSSGFTGKQHIMKPDIQIHTYIYVSLSHTHSHTHSLWVSCGRLVAAEVGRETTGWVPRASYRQKGRWPYPSPAPRPPCSSRSPSNHTESYGGRQRGRVIYTDVLYVYYMRYKMWAHLNVCLKVL